jgi:hypothetical protein
MLLIELKTESELFFLVEIYVKDFFMYQILTLIHNLFYRIKIKLYKQNPSP